MPRRSYLWKKSDRFFSTFHHIIYMKKKRLSKFHKEAKNRYFFFSTNFCFPATVFSHDQLECVRSSVWSSATEGRTVPPNPFVAWCSLVWCVRPAPIFRRFGGGSGMVKTFVTGLRACWEWLPGARSLANVDFKWKLQVKFLLGWSSDHQKSSRIEITKHIFLNES